MMQRENRRNRNRFPEAMRQGKVAAVRYKQLPRRKQLYNRRNLCPLWYD